MHSSKAEIRRVFIDLVRIKIDKKVVYWLAAIVFSAAEDANSVALEKFGMQSCFKIVGSISV